MADQMRRTRFSSKEKPVFGFFRFILNNKYEVTIYISNPEKFTYRELLNQLIAQEIIQFDGGPRIKGEKLVIKDKDGNVIQ